MHKVVLFRSYALWNGLLLAANRSVDPVHLDCFEGRTSTHLMC